MPNINAFRPVVHEKKIFLRFINIFLILPPQACFPTRLVGIGQVVLEKKLFKGKS